MKKPLAVAVILLFMASSFGAVGQNENLVSDNNHAEFFLVEIRNIAGGIGVHAEIVSGTHEDLDNIGWRISLNKGGLILIGKERTGTIGTLPAGGTAKIWSFVFGIFGRGVCSIIKIEVLWQGANIEERYALGEVIGPFVRNIFVDPHMV